MSKKGKVTRAKNWGKDSSVPGEEETASVISLSKDGRICVKILAKPGAKQSNITDISSDGLGVQIGALAREGEANEELIRFLAEVLNVRKRSLSLDKGSKSKQKIVSIESTEINIEQVRERLSQNVLKE
ncbi:unnamed protein product [Porites lobata]|uniref:Uncharacterized protein n=1 Tax=Porites lobata TaxID=104759 RepID=A0ABN8RGC5_9CNID|nr:unnamed protein product [Porites lobata]